MSWPPVVCWVRPTAYTIVMTLSGRPISPTSLQISRNCSFGIPVMSETTSGV